VADQNVDMEIVPSLHVETPNIPKQQAPENSEEEEEVHHEASRFHLLQHPKQDLQEASERDIPSVVGAKAKMQSQQRVPCALEFQLHYLCYAVLQAQKLSLSLVLAHGHPCSWQFAPENIGKYSRRYPLHCNF